MLQREYGDYPFMPWTAELNLLLVAEIAIDLLSSPAPRLSFSFQVGFVNLSRTRKSRPAESAIEIHNVFKCRFGFGIEFELC